MTDKKYSSATGVIYTYTPNGYVNCYGNLFSGCEQALKDVPADAPLYYRIEGVGYVSATSLTTGFPNTTLEVWERIPDGGLALQLAKTKVVLQDIIDQLAGSDEAPLMYYLKNDTLTKRTPMGVQKVEEGSKEWLQQIAEDAVSEYPLQEKERTEMGKQHDANQETLKGALDKIGQVSDMVAAHAIIDKSILDDAEFDTTAEQFESLSKGDEILIIGAGEGVGKSLLQSSTVRIWNLPVIQWALDRNIICGATIDGQIGKLQEELQELIDALAVNDQLEVKDAIGDCMVVLTMIATMRGLTLEECYQRAYEEIKDRKGRMINGAFVKEANLPENQ